MPAGRACFPVDLSVQDKEEFALAVGGTLPEAANHFVTCTLAHLVVPLEALEHGGWKCGLVVHQSFPSSFRGDDVVLSLVLRTRFVSMTLSSPIQRGDELQTS